MGLKCDSCDGTQLKMTIYEMKVLGQTSIYSAVKCEDCDMLYPLAQLAKNHPREAVVGMLRSN